MSTGTQIEVVMPQMGVSVSEGTVTRWLKQPGESIALDEPLLEISTDKVDTEVPSPGEGVVAEIRVQEGETVEVGTVLATIAPGRRCRRRAGGSGPRRTGGARAGRGSPRARAASARAGRGTGTRRRRAHARRGVGVGGQRQAVRLSRRRADRRTARRRPERGSGHGPGRARDEEGHPCLHRVGRGRRPLPSPPSRGPPSPPSRAAAEAPAAPSLAAAESVAAPPQPPPAPTAAPATAPPAPQRRPVPSPSQPQRRPPARSRSR